VTDRKIELDRAMEVAQVWQFQSVRTDCDAIGARAVGDEHTNVRRRVAKETEHGAAVASHRGRRSGVSGGGKREVDKLLVEGARRIRSRS
jgi:hypothetical protein